MKILVLKESDALENRVSAIPETVKKFVGLGAEMVVESGAGEAAGIADSEFTDAGAEIGTRQALIGGADAIFCVRGPDAGELTGAKKGTLLIGALDPFNRGDAIKSYADAGIDALAMEWMPRITRAQSMDILSSQSNLAGYKAVIDAASEYGRAFPMMMTAAGTVTAAKCFVMGVGVAGLQAIATAKRLGAQVSATDVRPETAEQIESLGAKPIFDDELAAAGEGGYAAELTDEQRAKQAELVSSHIAKQDIVITTALIPGRPAPRLVSDDQLATMRAGSVIVDLAAEQGGNVEGCVPGETTEKHGVKIIGPRNLAGQMASDSSALFVRNLYNFLSAFWDEEAKAAVLPDDDELVQGIRLTKDGAVVHERLGS